MSDYFGDRIRGYVCPPQTGYYVFYIASDDQGELWLSTNDQVTNKRKIAYTNEWTNPGEYTKFATQQSAPIYLQAGQRYYIETLHNEGFGGDHLSVGWKLPDNVLERPISGSHLIAFNTGTSSTLSVVFSDGNLLPNQPTQPLLTIFPNPVSENATVEFTSIEPANAVLNLYDLQGRLILEIFKGRVGVGVITTNLNAQGMENGAYIVRLIMGKSTLTKKIVIRKD
jgi:hypothetical protein